MPVGPELSSQISARAHDVYGGDMYIYSLVMIDYLDQFNNLKSVDYRCSVSPTTGAQNARMISEEEASTTLSSCIGQSDLPGTEDFDEIWEYVVQKGEKSPW